MTKKTVTFWCQKEGCTAKSAGTVRYTWMHTTLFRQWEEDGKLYLCARHLESFQINQHMILNSYTSLLYWLYHTDEWMAKHRIRVFLGI